MLYKPLHKENYYRNIEHRKEYLKENKDVIKEKRINNYAKIKLIKALPFYEYTEAELKYRARPTLPIFPSPGAVV